MILRPKEFDDFGNQGLSVVDYVTHSDKGTCYDFPALASFLSGNPELGSRVSLQVSQDTYSSN